MAKNKPFDVDQYRDLLDRCEVAFLADVEYAIKIATPAGKITADRARRLHDGGSAAVSARPFGSGLWHG